MKKKTRSAKDASKTVTETRIRPRAAPAQRTLPVTKKGQLAREGRTTSGKKIKGKKRSLRGRKQREVKYRAEEGG